MKTFYKLDRRTTADHLGFIPLFLNEKDPQSAIEQFNKNYQHGGGWNKIDGFDLDHADMSIQYPGDEKLLPLAVTTLHNKEQIYIYPHAWVLVLNQETKAYEVARMD